MGYHKNCHWPVNDNFCLRREWVITENCHWPVNDNFSQFNGLIWSGLMQRIMHSYGHTTYGHMSLTTVNDKKLWTKLKKVSLTLVNDKKIVIDHGQWQKKLSLTESDLYRDGYKSIYYLSKVNGDLQNREDISHKERTLHIVIACDGSSIAASVL